MSSSLNVWKAFSDTPWRPLIAAFGFELVPYHGRNSEPKRTAEPMKP